MKISRLIFSIVVLFMQGCMPMGQNGMHNPKDQNQLRTMNEFKQDVILGDQSFTSVFRPAGIGNKMEVMLIRSGDVNLNAQTFSSIHLLVQPQVDNGTIGSNHKFTVYSNGDKNEWFFQYTPRYPGEYKMFFEARTNLETFTSRSFNIDFKEYQPTNHNSNYSSYVTPGIISGSVLMSGMMIWMIFH